MKLLDWLQSWQGELTFAVLSLALGIFLLRDGDGGVAVIFFVLAVGSFAGAWGRRQKYLKENQKR